MRKLTNRLLVVLIMLLLAVSALPAAVFAESKAETIFNGWNLSLGEDVSTNFYFSIAETDVENTVANITVANNSISVNTTDAVYKNGCYVFTVDMAAAQMTDVISVELVTNETVVHSGEYSIRQYAETILAGEYDSATKELVLQMLGYGAAAQNYFGYKTESLANAGYENQISMASVPESIDSIAVEGSVEGIKLYGMSLVFESRIAVRFYYSVSGDVNNYTFSDGENTYKPQPKDGLYYVEVTGINPQDYSNVISMSVSDDTDSMTVGYSPLHYIVRKYYGNASDTLKTLVQAMYGYHLEAAEYSAIASDDTLELTDSYNMNTDGNDFSINDEALNGNLLNVTVKNTDIVLEKAKLDNSTLTIPAASFQLDTMPSGELTLEVATDTKTIEITGNFIWVINNASELLKMKNHMIADGTTYTGLLALGADIDLTDVAIKSTGLSGTTFAGEFDGRRHILSNLNCNTNIIGLFGNVSGTIKNLKVTNATVSTYTAAVVGGGLTGTLENIYVQGSITADGMAATSNLANFGAGLLVGRIQAGAKISNCIVELTSIADGLRLATAYGKLHQAVAEENVFTNCYAIGAENCTFMKYGTWEKVSFTNGGRTFATMDELLTDEHALALAIKLGLIKTSKVLALENSFDMNVPGNDLVIEDTSLVTDLISISVKGTEISLTGATIADGRLIIPAAAFQLSDIPSGTLTLLVETEGCSYEITGDFVWVINNASELLKMKNHLIADGTTYTGSLALGADIDLASVTIKNSGLLNMTFAGLFDGRLYTLSNVNANTGNSGLLSNVSGTIKNLKIINATVSSNTAAVVGGALTGTLENIYVQGSITADGMGATSNLANFGSGLLAGRIQAGAKINNCIVELSSITDDLRLATAFGKLHGASTSETIFTNCYAVGANGCTYMPYNQGWVKQSFSTGGTNKNFDSVNDLCQDAEAGAVFFLLMPPADFVEQDSGDYSVAGTVHTYSISDTQNYICKKGASEYTVVISNVAETRVAKAAKEFTNFFNEATGIQLPMIYAEDIASYTLNSKYIVFGSNTVSQAAGLSANVTELGEQGFRIKTVGNSIFVIGGSDAGVQYGAYELLTQLFQFDYFGKDNYQLDRNVKELPLKNYDITDVPDIGIRRPNYLFLMTNTETSDRLRLMNWGDLIIPVGGAYVHNSSKYISKADYPDKQAWFATDGKNLCYTAHGDTAEMEQMQRIVADVIIGSFKENPEKKLITMTQEDTQTLCTCSACTALMNQYNNSQAASVVIFLNGVCEMVEDYFASEEGKQYDRDFRVLFFAYHATNKPPVVYDSKQQAYVPVDEKVICNTHLIPYFAETNGDYTTDFYDTGSVNATYAENLKGWAVLSQEVYFWMYSTNFMYYLIPYNSFDATQANYKYAIENKVDFIYDQAQSNQTGSATGWSWLKIYLYSKLTWNVDQNMDELIDRYMDGAFGPAADTVKDVFYSWKYFANYQSNVLGYSGSRSIFYEALDSKLWNRQLLQSWTSKLTQALEEVAYLKDTDENRYNIYVKNISTERIAYNYLLLSLFQSEMTQEEIALAKEQFYHDQLLANIGLQSERNGTVADLMTKLGITES